MYNRKFIFDSYSSRKEKGIHRAHKRFHDFAWKLSQNNTKTVWVLKCDIKKFFDSVDHEILVKIISETIKDEKVLDLLKKVIYSFERTSGKGIPLGNLTSQLFSNVYLDVLDQYIKRVLKVKYYLRYADDFVIFDRERILLLNTLDQVKSFLNYKLKLSIHPDKIHIRKFSQGVDFLGYVIFPYHQVLRTKTKKRILKNVRRLNYFLENKIITQEYFDQVLSSYLGLLNHCYGNGIRKMIERMIR